MTSTTASRQLARAQEIADQASSEHQARELAAAATRNSGESTPEPRRGGAGMHLTPVEKREIAIAYLTDPDLGTVSACAKKFGRTREAVAGCLRGDAFKALQAQIDTENAEAAKRILKSGVTRAAALWAGTAIPKAAERGDHKPARDLLIATKVIEPAPKTGGMYLGITVNNVKQWYEAETGRVVEQLPEGALGVSFDCNDSDVQIGPDSRS